MDGGPGGRPRGPGERGLVGALTADPRRVDEVVRVSGWAAKEVSATLALLELKGLVREVGSMQYVRVREDDAAYQGAISEVRT